MFKICQTLITSILLFALVTTFVAKTGLLLPIYVSVVTFLAILSVILLVMSPTKLARIGCTYFVIYFTLANLTALTNNNIIHSVFLVISAYIVIQALIKKDIAQTT